MRETLEKFAAGLNRGTWLPDRLMHDEYEARRPVAGRPMDVVFVRRDGWTLGAPARLEAAARRTWSQEWLAVLRRLDDDYGWRLEALDGAPYA